MLTRAEFQDWHIQPVLADFRAADREEVWASCMQTPEEALRGSTENSTEFCETLLWNDSPVAILGVGEHTTHGAPWMLSVESRSDWSKPFIKLGIDIVLEMSDMYPILSNYVDSRNSVSIKWLQFVGFTISFDSPIDVRGIKFYNFWRSV